MVPMRDFRFNVPRTSDIPPQPFSAIYFSDFFRLSAVPATPSSLSLLPDAGPIEGPEDLGRWVVVSGFAPGEFTSPIRALQQIGQITKHAQSSTRGGNYLFVQVQQKRLFLFVSLCLL